MYKYLTLSLAGILLSPALSLAALSTNNPSEFTAEDAAYFNSLSREEQDKLLKVSAPEGTVNCFDYYHFGSVAVSLNSMPYPVGPGLVPFTGEIKNENDYPIVDALVYAKIFRIQETTTNEQILNGDFLVDQLVASERIDLGAHESKPFEFVWQSPEVLMPGTYRIATYIIAADKFNLAGLSFTDDVDGDSETFTVDAKNDPIVEWNKNGVLVNDTPYYFAKPIPKFAQGTPVIIKAPLENPTSKTVGATITWDTYSWDAQSFQNRVRKEEVTVTLAPGETKTVSYTPPQVLDPVTFVVGTVNAGGARSIINVRFAHLGATQARINFPALTKFPLRVGERVELFSCLHTVNPEGVDSGTLTLTLLNGAGEEVGKTTYSGKVTGDMMGYADTLTVGENLTKATLRAELAYGDRTEVVDMHYDCERIGGTACENFETGGSNDSQTSTEKGGEKILLLGILLAGCICIMVIGIMYMRKKKTPGTPPIAPLVIALLLCGGLLGSSSPVEAASVSWTNSTPFNPPCFQTAGGVTNSVNCLKDVVSTVDYVSNSLPPEGTLVKTGDTIKITIPESTTDITWNGTGTYTDSPYGYWDTNWHTSCLTYSNFVGSGGLYTPYLYGQMIVTRPAITITGTGMTCSGTAPTFTCQVTAANGPVSAKVDFPNTTGKIRLEAWVEGDPAGEEPPVGYVPHQNLNRKLSFIDNVIKWLIPTSYAALPIPTTNGCIEGQPLDFTVGAQSITHTFTVDNNALMPNITAGSPTQSTAVAGTATQFTGIVTNSGGVSTGSGFQSFIRVASGANGGGSVIDLPPTAVPALSPAQSGGVSGWYTFPGSGTYSVQICGDMTSSSGGGTIAEAQEGDNCGLWRNVTVTAPPSVDVFFTP